MEQRSKVPSKSAASSRDDAGAHGDGRILARVAGRRCYHPGLLAVTAALVAAGCAGADPGPETTAAAAGGKPDAAASPSCAEPPPPGALWLQAERCLPFTPPLAVYRLAHHALVSAELVGADGRVFLRDLRTKDALWFTGSWTNGRAADLHAAAPSDAWLEEFDKARGLLLEDGLVAPVPPMNEVVGRRKPVRVDEAERAALLSLANAHVMQHVHDQGRWTAACEHASVIELGAVFLREGF
jgi:hypothetical protein